MGKDAADILMASLPPLGWEDLATKTDLDLLRAESAQQHADMRTEAAQQHADMRAESGQQHAEMTARFTQQLAATARRLEARFDGKFAALAESHTKLDARIGGLDARVGKLEERVGKLEERVGSVQEQVAALDKRMSWHFGILVTLMLGLFGLPIAHDMVRPPQPAPIVITIASPTPTPAPAPLKTPPSSPSGQRGPRDKR